MAGQLNPRQAVRYPEHPYVSVVTVLASMAVDPYSYVYSGVALRNNMYSK